MTMHDRAKAPRTDGAHPWVASRATLFFAALMAVTLVACAVVPVPPSPSTFDCLEVDEGAAGPTLVCTSDDGVLTVRIPWQGAALAVEALSLDGFWQLPAASGFAPLTGWPLHRLAVSLEGDGTPVTTFDPPIWLTVAYGQAQFQAARPLVDTGELGLGVWDETAEAWIVIGHGVFHEGFWLADPVADGSVLLATDVAAGQPRFQMTGSATGGQAVAVVASMLPTMPLMWGKMPPDPDHMLKEFDGPCEEVTVGVGTAVECVSTMVGLTVRVPLQNGGQTTPRVIALPWNKATTFEVDGSQPSRAQEGGDTLVRRLMNFLVVDADDPTQVLTSFDPPLEFEIAYTAADKDPVTNPILVVKYWDEYVEQWVWLGYGFADECTDTSGATSGGCVWGLPAAALVTDDPRFFGEGFFLSNEDGQGGIAKFRYGLWGDRLVAFGR